MDWMGDTCDVEGKLECPKCKGRIGSYTWHGAQCSCGCVGKLITFRLKHELTRKLNFRHWCTPAFQVLQSRVDEIMQIAIRQIPVVHKTPELTTDETAKISENELQEFL